MSDLEKARAQAEALGSAPTMSSADRARFWAGLNRYLAAEAQHARSTSAADDETPEPEATDDSE